MKGVTFLTDETNKKRLLQIDVKEIARNPEKFEDDSEWFSAPSLKFEDLLDIVIAEARKDEPKISWEVAKKKLKK
mgnify:CR=1 FL=1